MRVIITAVVAASIALVTMGAANGCDPQKPTKNTDAVNAEDGKHTVTELGKWKYGNVMAPSPKFPQCRWEIWGLQKDGWKQLYKGKGVGKVELPPKGVYAGAYLKSTSCGKWHVAS